MFNNYTTNTTYGIPCNTKALSQYIKGIQLALGYNLPCLYSVSLSQDATVSFQAGDVYFLNNTVIF